MRSRPSVGRGCPPESTGAGHQKAISRRHHPRFGKTVRLRDKDHRRFVLRQACLVCGRVPSDPHHLTFTQPRAPGLRVSVPVCRVHHRELHRSGDEAAWWRKLNIDPLPVALRLWQHTRADGELTPTMQIQAVKTADVKPAAKAPLLTELQNLVTRQRATKRRPRDSRYARRDDALRGGIRHSQRGRIRRFRNGRPPRKLASERGCRPNSLHSPSHMRTRNERTSAR